MLPELIIVLPHFKNENRELDTYARAMLHGEGYDRWFDKSFNLIFGRNAKMGKFSTSSYPILIIKYEF